MLDRVEKISDSPGDYYRPLKLFGLKNMVNPREMTEATDGKIIRKDCKCS